MNTENSVFEVGGGEATSPFRFLSIFGLIEGHTAASDAQKVTKYEQVIPLLAAIEDSPHIRGLLVLIHTVGGDVEAGLAMAELIASLSKPTVSLVTGGGHSIGVPLAVAAKRSFIVPSATMTLHPVRMNGTVIGAPQTYRQLHDMQTRITSFVCRHSRIREDQLLGLMMAPDQIAADIGTILAGPEAVSLGLVDSVGGLSDALAALRLLCQ